ncbi:helix-turn-helix domain-containing protein [Halosegnis rubeus]|uniref:Helix-turn-helix domain-containing protein n=1 Tax=Halosegnis rubeus TaxID=2212850 RepID=A0A5N5UFB8_9EURY|nr:helix-turn-helix domain-containing protein [Halosegnis rubeus]KAB7515624.1 helix-turn-helix domain-containing protein [Halosegnis rubeus]KAB7517170.1 helix-turn-helix domain-containing protein [Halosegnis rubeus]
MSNPFEESVDPAAVLAALDDEACRELIGELDTPHTADELAEASDIARSTVYRKLDILTDAGLVDERTEVRSDGHHTTRYVLDFEAVHVLLDNDRHLDIEVDRPEEGPDERVARLWTEIRDST